MHYGVKWSILCEVVDGENIPQTNKMYIFVLQKSDYFCENYTKELNFLFLTADFHFCKVLKCVLNEELIVPEIVLLLLR